MFKARYQRFILLVLLLAFAVKEGWIHVNVAAVKSSISELQVLHAWPIRQLIQSAL